MVVVLLAVPSSSYVVAYSFLPEVDEVDDTSFVLLVVVVGEKEKEASSSYAVVVAVVDAYLMVVSSSVEASSSSADDVGASFVHVDIDVEEVVGLPYYFLLPLRTAVYFHPTWR
jgi:hypothetical protein